jgi:hypothetical protein
MAVLSIQYNGGLTYDDDDNRVGELPVYESVRLWISTSDKEFIFDSGNFPKDWYEAKKKYQEFMDIEPFLSGSSSCDHFIMDGAPYDSAYLHVVDDKPVFLYVDKSKSDWYIKQAYIFDEGWEFFVPENTTPTWEEFKELIK